MSDDEQRADPWAVVERLQEYRGEERANLLRVIGIALFYVVQLVNHHGLSLGPIHMPRVEGVDERFHAAMTAVTVAWVMTAVATLLLMRNRVFPPALKYVTTAVDLTLLTAVLIIADGPSSVLVIVYFLVVVLSSLRFSLPLVRFATVGAAGSYVLLLGHTRLYREALVVPRYEQVVTLLSIVLTGVVLGQVLRSGRRVARELVARGREEA